MAPQLKRKGNSLEYQPTVAFKYRSHVRDINKGALYGVQFNHFLGPKEPLIFASISGNRAYLYECTKDGAIKLLQCYGDQDEQEEFWTICFSRMKLTKISSILVAAGKRGVIRVIDLTRMKCEHSFIGHTGSIHEVKVSPSDASLLLSAGNDRSIRLWSIDTLMCVAVFSGHRAQVLTVDFNASGDRFLSGSVDNSVRIWNLPTSEIERAKGATCTGPHKVYEADFSTLAIHENYVDSAHWFGDLIFSKSSGSNSQKIVCWQPLQDGSARFLHDFPTQNCKNWSMRFNLSYDHTMMALGTDNGKTYVWDLNKPNPTDIKGIRLPNTYSTSSIRQTAFSRDGKVLICGAEDGTILRWDRVE